MKDKFSILLKENCKALEAIKIINKTEFYIALIVDHNFKMVGTITDGDIRRGLLKGYSLESEAKNFMNKDFKYISEENMTKLNVNKFFDSGISLIPLLNKEGKVKELLKKEDLLLKQNNLIDTAVIMAGGEGKRLMPKTSNCPKPMIKIKGKPMLEIILEKCINFGFKNFYFSVNYLKEQIIDYFGDGRKWGVKINYLTEDSPLGTAGSLKFIPKSIQNPYLVLNGDIITNLDLRLFVQFHKKYSASITVAAKYEANKIPYGVLYTSGVELLKIEEKPIQKILVSAGVYIINPEILSLLNENEYYDMPNLITLAKKNNFKILTFPIYEYWQDVGRPETLEVVNQEWDQN